MGKTHLIIGLLLLLGAILTAAPATGADVDVRLDTFGVGSAFRSGEFTAIRLGLTSNLAEPSTVWVQWDIPNADGDVAEYGRSLTLTPSRESLIWLYAPVPPHSDATAVWQIRVLEEQDGQIGRDMGGAIISPADAQSSAARNTTAMIGLIGGWSMQLETLTAFPAGLNRQPQIAHEDTRLVRGIGPRDLPDRWEGLRGFEALVWGDARQNRPEDLTTDQARALAAYVQRGGHLVIALPTAGNPWHLGAPGRLEPDLERMLPKQTPRKDEDVEFDSLLPVIAKLGWKDTYTGARYPEYQGSLRVFAERDTDFNVIDNWYEPLITLADGRVVVIQRTYGFGRVTVIGMNLSPGTFLNTNSAGQVLGTLPLPEADVFWNRILGWRADSVSSTDVKALDDAMRIVGTGGPDEINLGGDRLIGGQINMSSSAAQGLMLALLLFIVYWLVAGPIGFAVLKAYKKSKHSWLAFAGTAAVFTAVAWIAVGMIRPRAVTVKHLTVLDYLARPGGDRGDNDPQIQRASSYFSLYLPTYRRMRTTIMSEAGQRDLLATWAPPLAPAQPFPNVDRYRINVGRLPASYEIPTRATATQMYAHWMGGLDPQWGGVLYADPEDPIRVVKQGETESSLQGSIISDLPGTLTDVAIYWVSNKRVSPRRYETGSNPLPVVSHFQRGSTLNIGRMNRLGSLDKGQSIDLRSMDYSPTASGLETNIRKEYIEAYTRGFHGPGSAGPSAQDRRNYLEMLSLYRQLTPPEYFVQTSTSQVRDSVIAQRVLGRELDLSSWFNRPCLIIIGHLDNTDLPIPLTVGGNEPRSASGSLTVVRWIYPLPLDEDIAFQQPEGG